MEQDGPVTISSQVAYQVDVGEGREFEVEYQGDESLWAVIGPGIEDIRLWCTAAAGGVDLRVRVVRTQLGIEVSIDRGQEKSSWWPVEDSPRLIVAIDPGSKSLLVSARVGRGADLREAVLGKRSVGD